MTSNGRPPGKDRTGRLNLRSEARVSLSYTAHRWSALIGSVQHNHPVYTKMIGRVIPQIGQLNNSCFT